MEAETNELFEDDSKSSIQDLIDKLNDRANERHRVAFRFLLLCFLILAIGLSIFIFANKLSGSESVTGSFNRLRKTNIKMDSLDLSIRKATLIISELESDVVSMRNVLSQMNDSDRTNFTGPYSYPKSIRLVKSLDTILNKFYDYSSQELIVTYKNFGSLIESYDKMNDNIERLDSAAISYEFFTALSARIGAVVIIFFLIQVLVRIYRYNTRLGNYYKARADALELYQEDDSLPLDKLIEVLSPDSLDIGMAKTPIAQVVEIFKHAQNQTKKD